MAKIIHSENEVKIGSKVIKLYNEKIRLVEQFEDIAIIILQGDYPPNNKNYNNAFAVRVSDGNIIWEIEGNQAIDYANPYEGVTDAGAYFIFFKANSGKYAVNKNNGKIIKNIDLMTGQRPW